MEKLEYPAKVIGNELTTPTGVATTVSSFIPAQGNGDILGLSVAENYDKAVLSQVYCTIEHNNRKLLESAPLSVLIPTIDRPYFPFEIKVGIPVKVTLDSRNATLLAANKINILTHHRATN